MLHATKIGEEIPLIILHGFLGMGDNWKTLAKQFALEGYQVHLIDQRNHGRSFHSNDFSYEFMAQDLKEYCDKNELNSIVLLGHSMGGKTAMLFATMYPKFIDKLVIADIGPKMYPQHHQRILESLQSLQSNSEALKSRSSADELLATYISDIGTRMFLLKNLYWVKKGQLGLRMNLPVLVKNIDEVGKALPDDAHYDGEVLFLRGANSNYILDEDIQGIERAFAKAKIKTIPEAGHWLHAENPKDFYKEVINFL